MAIPTKTSTPKVIVIGGGPVGLTAALGLSRAGIDFVLLERRPNVVVNEGSDMTLLPPTMPMLDQLNLLGPLSDVWNTVTQIDRIDHNGHGMGAMYIGQALRNGTGYYPQVISRQSLLDTLYTALPEKDRILTNKKVRDIHSTPDGVSVTCESGETYRGTFVIGADGAYSAVRKCMRKLALASGEPETNPVDPFLTTYQALWIRFPTTALPGCSPGMAIETHGSGIATQLFAGKSTATIGVYRTLPKPTHQSLRYNEKDELALVEEWGHLPLLQGGNVHLKDVYDIRLDSGLVSLEEGVLPHWSWDGRIVLVGDAAHKFTPSMGSGMNFGVQDVVLLMNEICSPSSAPASWSRSSLADAFQRYQQKRMNDVQAGCQESSGATAMATWSTTSSRLFDQYVIPTRFVQWLLGVMMASRARKAKPIEFNFG